MVISEVSNQSVCVNCNQLNLSFCRLSPVRLAQSEGEGRTEGGMATLNNSGGSGACLVLWPLALV